MHVIDRLRELFQQGNARPDTARLTMDYLEQNNINVLPWLSKSPDLNPIEPLLDHLDKVCTSVNLHLRRSINSAKCCNRNDEQYHEIMLENRLSLCRGDVEQCWPRAVVIHGTNFNVTGSVLNCDKLTFIH